jgi:hypothetical protein
MPYAGCVVSLATQAISDDACSMLSVHRCHMDRYLQSLNQQERQISP